MENLHRAIELIQNQSVSFVCHNLETDSERVQQKPESGFSLNECRDD